MNYSCFGSISLLPVIGRKACLTSLECNDLHMPAKKTDGLLEIEFPKGSGIKIKEVVNISSGVAYGGSYDVVIPAKVTGRGRLRKRFKDLVDGRLFAKQQHKGSGARGTAYFNLDPQQQDEVAALVPELEESGQSLDELKEFLKCLDGDGVKLSDLARGVSRLSAKGLVFERSITFCETHLMAEGGDITFAEVVEKMIVLKKERVEKGSLRPVSLDTFVYLTRRMASGFGEIKMELVSRKVVLDWIDGLKVSGRSNQNFLDTCIEVFNHAIEEGYVKFSPLSGFKGQKRKALTGSSEQAPIEVLSMSEANKLLEKTLELRELGFLGYVVLTLFCGVRAEEAKRLEWKDVHDELSKPYLTISAKIAKKRRIRNVEIPPNAVLWLSLIKDRSGQVVEFRDKNHFDRMYRKLRARAGFRKKGDKGGWVSTWNNNAIRHSFGTYHFALHGDPIKTAVQMGHKSNDQVLFDHYRALATEEQGEVFFSIVPPKSESKLVEFAG